MSPSIDIPAPLADDSDSVVTALETAAVFAGRGDAVEALRWLKRAAESSGETGDDLRTLTLARTAADLTTQIQSAQGTTLSAPPPSAAASAAPAPQKASETPRSGALPAVQRASQPASSAAKISPIVQISDRPGPSPSSLPSDAAPATQTPRPSQRWLPKPPPRTPSIPTGAERTATRPPPPSSRPLTPTPPIAEARPIGAGNSIPPTTRESALPSRDTLTPARDTLTSAIPASVAGALAQSPISVKATNGERRPLSVGPRSSARVEGTEPEAPRLRPAARVSVVRSSTERGLYLVRVLEEGKPIPSDGAEGWLLLVDPNSDVFSR